MLAPLAPPSAGQSASSSSSGPWLPLTVAQSDRVRTNKEAALARRAARAPRDPIPPSQTQAVADRVASLSSPQRRKVEASRDLALAKRRAIDYERALAANPLSNALQGASLRTTVDGQVTATETLPSGPHPRLLPPPPARASRGQAQQQQQRLPLQPRSRLDCEDPSDDEHQWYSTSQAGPSDHPQVISLPPGCPRPRIKLKLKTKLARIRCNKKSFAPCEFSGFIGAARRRAHPSHTLATARGIVWCWKCGHVAKSKPRGLVQPCTTPTPHGAATITRIRRGLPPYNFARWPGDAPYRRLVGAQTQDIWGTSTQEPKARPPGSARRQPPL